MVRMETPVAANAHQDSSTATAVDGANRAAELPDVGAITSVEEVRSLALKLNEERAKAATEVRAEAGTDESTPEQSQDSNEGEQTEAAPDQGEQSPAPTEQSPEKTEVEDGEEADEDTADWREAKRTRLNLESRDEVTRMAVVLMRRNRDMGVEEALEKARAKLGVSPAASAAQPAAEDATKAPAAGPDPLVELESKLAAARAAHKAAMDEFDVDKAHAAMGEVEKLVGQVAAVKTAAATAKAKPEAAKPAPATTAADEAEAARQANAAAQQKALELYPDVANGKSPLFLRMVEIDAQLKATDNPLYYDPGKYLRVAQMAANDLGIPPGRKAQPAAQPKPKPTPAPQPFVGVRTATQQKGGDAEIERRVQAARDEDDYRALLRELKLRRA